MYTQKQKGHPPRTRHLPPIAVLGQNRLLHLRSGQIIENIDVHGIFVENDPVYDAAESDIFLESRKAVGPQYVGNGPDVIQHLPLLVFTVCAFLRSVVKAEDSHEMELLKNMADRLELKEKRAKAAYMDGIDSLEEYKQNKLLIQKERETLAESLKQQIGRAHV